MSYDGLRIEIELSRSESFVLNCSKYKSNNMDWYSGRIMGYLGGKEVEQIDESF